jgi:DNA-binding transcriptional MerR regulator
MAQALESGPDMDELDFGRGSKSADAFRTISEVATDLDVPQHVLRFWETRFNQIRPLKRAGGRRYYRPEDVALLRRIRELLYQHGFTIRGVQKLLRDGGRPRNGERPAAPAPGPAATAPQGARAPEPAKASVMATAADPAANPAELALRSATERARLRGVLDEMVAIRDMLRGRGR